MIGNDSFHISAEVSLSLMYSSVPATITDMNTMMSGSPENNRYRQQNYSGRHSYCCIYRQSPSILKIKSSTPYIDYDDDGDNYIRLLIKQEDTPLHNLHHTKATR